MKKKRKERGKSIYTKKSYRDCVASLSNFVLIAFMTSFAMLMMFADHGAELSRLAHEEVSPLELALLDKAVHDKHSFKNPSI